MSELICVIDKRNSRTASFGRLSRAESGYFLDHQWHCSLRCLYKGLVPRLSQLPTGRRVPSAGGVRPSLGLILMKERQLHPDELKQALAAQRHGPPTRIGELLRRRGCVGEEDVTRALSRQFGLPRVDFLQADISREAIRFLPGVIARTYQAFPADFRSRDRLLVLAIVGPPDFGFLSALGRMLECDVRPLVARESEIQRLVDHFYPDEEWGDRYLSYPSWESELAAAELTEQARKYGANELRVERCGSRVWVRLSNEGRRRDLLLQVEPPRSTLLMGETQPNELRG